MEAMRESWTDARLDDFSRHVDERFDRVDARLEQVDQRFDRVESELRHQRSELRHEFAAFHTEMSLRLDSLHRLTIQIGAGMFATLAIGILAMLAN